MVKLDGAKVPSKEGKHHRRTDGRRASKEHWKSEPDAHDYPAASDYLSLIVGDGEAERIVDGLRAAPLVRRKAKDLLRASRLALLDPGNAHVAADLLKVRRGEKLSPVLLVRGVLASDIALTIADGYHRICASYHLDENADIPCRLLDFPGSRRAAANGSRSRAGARRTRPARNRAQSPDPTPAQPTPPHASVEESGPGGDEGTGHGPPGGQAGTGPGA